VQRLPRPAAEPPAAGPPAAGRPAARRPARRRPSRQPRPRPSAGPARPGRRPAAAAGRRTAAPRGCRRGSRVGGQAQLLGDADRPGGAAVGLRGRVGADEDVDGERAGGGHAQEEGGTAGGQSGTAPGVGATDTTAGEGRAEVHGRRCSEGCGRSRHDRAEGARQQPTAMWCGQRGLGQSGTAPGTGAQDRRVVSRPRGPGSGLPPQLGAGGHPAVDGRGAARQGGGSRARRQGGTPFLPLAAYRVS
jgi:translation initiation factor IF-2